MPFARRLVLLMTVIALPSGAIENPHIVGLADVSTDQNVLLRGHGHTGTGAFGVPVASTRTGTARSRYAFSSMRASPQFRTGAGEVYLLFGDGAVVLLGGKTSRSATRHCPRNTPCASASASIWET